APARARDHPREPLACGGACAARGERRPLRGRLRAARPAGSARRRARGRGREPGALARNGAGRPSPSRPSLGHLAAPARQRARVRSGGRGTRGVRRDAGSADRETMTATALPFRIGVMQLTMEPLDEVLAHARALDAAGFDTIWLAEAYPWWRKHSMEARSSTALSA